MTSEPANDAEPRPTLAVGAVVVHEGSLLMVQRGSEPGRGLWSIPGGRVEPGEYLVDAVRREVNEETGLQIEVADLLGILEVPGDVHYVILDYVARVVGDPAPTPADDVVDARWVALDEIDQLDCTPRLLETLTSWGVLTDEERD